MQFPAAKAAPRAGTDYFATAQPMDYGYEGYGETTPLSPVEDTGEGDFMTWNPSWENQPAGGGGGGVDRWNEVLSPVDFADFDIGAMKELFPSLMLQDINAQTAEEMDMGGKRWSSILAQKQADANARAMEGWASNMFGMWIPTQEAAKQRQLQHREAAASRGAAAGARAQTLPLQVASMMANLAGMAQGAEEDVWGSGYGDWLRTTPEGAWSTYGQGLLGMVGQEPGGPTQYQPGWGSGLMGLGSALLPFTQGGGGSSYQQESWW